MIEYIVEYSRVLAGGQRPFDEAATRDLVRRDVERAHDFAAAQNHDAIAGGGGSHQRLSSIALPTLVIHGSADPMFPPEHGEALALEIQDATLLPLEGAGHGVYRADWETIVGAISTRPRPIGLIRRGNQAHGIGCQVRPQAQPRGRAGIPTRR